LRNGRSGLAHWDSSPLRRSATAMSMASFTVILDILLLSL
jgi:hypothetical protein